GIRDFHVTGVQTCALPISPSIDRSPNIAVTSDDDHGAFAVMGVLVGTDGDPTAATGCSRDRLKAAGFDASVGSTFTRAGGDGPRSEERRVGKERRWRW